MRQSKRIALNTLSSWGTMGVNAVVLIFLTKFLIHRLGTDQFGVLRYALAVEASLLFLDLGLGATLNRFVARLLATNDEAGVNAVVTLSGLFFVGLGVLAGLGMVVVGFFLPHLLTTGTPELYANGAMLMACIGGTLAVRFCSYAARGLLFGYQRHDLVNIIRCVTVLIRAALIVLLVTRMESAGLVMVGLAFLCSAVLESCGLWMAAKGVFPSMRMRVSIITRDLTKEFLGFSVYVLLMGLTTMIIVNLPTLMAGKFYGAEAVTFISLPLLVLSQIQGLAGGFAFMLIPVAGKYGAQKNQAALQEIMVRGTKYCALIVFPIGVTATIFGEPLFEWFEEGLGWTWELLAIMVFPILIRTTQRASFSVLIGAGSVKWLALAQIPVAATIVVLSWLLAEVAGLELTGIALGSAIPILVYGLSFRPAYACYQVGLPCLDYLGRAYLRVLLCTLITASAAVVLRWLMYPRGLPMIVMEGAICMVLFAGCAWRLALSEQERTQILGLFRRDPPPAQAAGPPAVTGEPAAPGESNRV